ncbi:MAG: flagellar basal body P-ring protein FlgI [Pseudomonadota bacterium]
MKQTTGTRIYPSIFTAMIFLLIWGFFSEASAVRIKELVAIKGVRENQLIGYGLVVGLNGTGDKSGAEFTVQSLANMMERMGIHVTKNQLKVKNVAAVMVTAQLPPFARVGSRIDIMVSSVGDAKSLAGGTLLLTPLRGVDGKVYALAQGALALGGIGDAGGGATKNHLLAARVAGGASIEKEVPMQLNGKKELVFTLFNPDFTTALRIADTINRSLGKKLAFTMDSGTLALNIPKDMSKHVASYIGRIENLEVVPDTIAKIVVNEKTGTIVIGENVRISTVAVSHGNLSITIKEHESVSQPQPLSQGETVTLKETGIEIKEDESKVILVPEAATIGELVRALNAIGVTPRDLISIFQSIKASGALQADLVII